MGLAKWQTDGFRWRRIESSLAYNPEWETPVSHEEVQRIQQILQQPFFYLGKGSQCYVFASEDGRYVVKFPRCDKWEIPSWMRLLADLPPTKKLCTQLMEKRKTRLEGAFTSYLIAYNQLQDETGLVHLHLNKTPDWNLSTPFYDKIGCVHEVKLGEMLFLLQRRATWIAPELKRLMGAGMEAEACQLIDEIVNALLLRAKRGLADKDPHITNNFGILDGKIVQIDIGRYQVDPERALPQRHYQELMKLTKELRPWLAKHYPILSKHLEHRLENLRTPDTR